MVARRIALGLHFNDERIHEHSMLSTTVLGSLCPDGFLNFKARKTATL